MLRTVVRHASSLRMASAPLRPLVAVIGATGTGKSDLAVDIARRFNGEIINGDAMQLYEGLPIITNKITEDEMKGVPHHLLGCIGLGEEPWTVGKFVGKALGVINEIRSRGKLPILVGGTHYYTQSLLFQDALAGVPVIEREGQDGRPPILDEPTEVLLNKLKEVDPVMADRWHPNERRKIQRSLEIYLKTGRPASQIYDEQRQNRDISPDAMDSAGALRAGPSLRFPTLLFWVHAPKDVLYPRLDGRIVKMLDRGLLSEVELLTRFRQDYEDRTRKAVDQSRGIWVSIGYKEFLDYQTALNEKRSLHSDLEKTKAAAIERTQAATRQYANRQIRWIRIKLLNALISSDQNRSLFLLDGTDLSIWEEHVLQHSRSITDDFLAGHALPDPNGLSTVASEMLTPKRDYDLSQRPDLWQKKTCETCGTVAVTENDWNLHIKSRTHRRAMAAKKKEENRKMSRPKDMKTVQVDMVDVLESYIRSSPADDPSK